ncbi:MAG: multidrug effflux MFS transporter [Pseudomonadota bacterium]
MASPDRSPPRISTLIYITGISVVSLNMFLPSLVNIAADLNADYALVSLSIAGYLGLTAVLQLIIGPLADRYGRRPIILGGIGIFTVASLGCLLAQNIWVFLGFRMLQGAIIAGGALSRVVVRDMMEPKEAASVLGYISMAMALAPMLGPTLGGVLDEAFGWRSSFAAFFLLGAVLWVLTWRDLGETNRAPSATFGAQFRTYPALLGAPLFWGHAACMAFSTGGFFVFIAGAPLVASTVFGLSPGWLGVAIGSITGGFIFGSFCAGRFARHFSLATMMLAGRVLACGGLTVGIVLFAAGFEHVLVFLGASMFVGIGNGVTMPSTNVGVMSVRPDLAGTASGVAGALNMAVGAGLTWVAGILISGNPAVLPLLGLMLATSFAGLLSALLVAYLDRSALPERA